MAFGQQSGPPSSAKQVAEITQLLEAAGYTSLREARHPFDLTQRQANGKFTQGEAAELIDRLQAAADEAEVDAGPAVSAGVLTAIPAEALADELVRRGWMCVPPS
jgi:hypothetical protein